MNFNDLNYTATILAQDAAGGGTGAAGDGTGATTGGGGMGHMLPLMIGMFVIFYFMMIRPQRKKQKEMQLMLDNMRIGDAVVSAGGIHGIITNKTDTTVTVKVATNVKMKFDKSSIGKVTPKDRVKDDEDDDDEEVEDEEEVAKLQTKKKAAAKKKTARKKKTAKKKVAAAEPAPAEKTEPESDDSDAEPEPKDEDEDSEEEGFGAGFGSDDEADESEGEGEGDEGGESKN